MKHQEMILAVDSALLRDHGIAFSDRPQLVPVQSLVWPNASIDLVPGLTLMQRNQLDNVTHPGNTYKGNRKYKQLLPYVVFYYPESDRVAVYRRCKGVGETRLEGNLSIGFGFGGHVDLADIVHENSVIQLNDTLVAAALRELHQEVQVTTLNGYGPEFTAKAPDLHLCGFLFDGSNDVGNLHLGVVYTVFLNEGDLVTTKEAALKSLPATRISELQETELTVESWSEFLVKSFNFKIFRQMLR